MISFTFDDGNKSVRSVAEPILRQYGMVGTVGAICDLVFWKWSRADMFMGPDDLRHLAEGGWEIASHSLFHRRMSALPPSYQDEIASWRFDAGAGTWIAELHSEDVGTIVCRERFLRRARSQTELTAMPEGFLIEAGSPRVYVKTKEENLAANELRFGSAERELAQSRKVFQQHGFDTDTFIVPMSNWSPMLQELGKKYYSFVACGGQRLNTAASISGKLLARIGTGAEVSLDDVIEKVEAHLAQDSWPILLFHKLTPEMQGKWNWTTGQFEHLVKWISDRGIQVCTLSEGARQLMA